MRAHNLIIDPEDYRNVIEDLIDIEFQGLFSPASSRDLEGIAFKNYFFSYFRDDIIERFYDGKNFYLTEREKNLEYLGKEIVEKPVEYNFLINNNESRIMKIHYAKKGGDFCVVFPALCEVDNEFFSNKASAFYSAASSLSTEKLPKEFYGFLEKIPVEMTSGLENILQSIRREGLTKVYENLVTRYESETDKEKSEEYAVKLARISRKLGMDEDDVPLRKEHYKFMFVDD